MGGLRMIENLKIDIVSEYIIEDKKSKGNKTTKHSDKVGSVTVDFCLSPESLEALTDVLTEKVFEHDAVKLNVTYETSSY